jgi:pimeloyl-ACP methyl ester carboxylesterase
MAIKRRVLLILAALIVLGAVTIYARFLMWRREIIDALTVHSTLVLTARGPMEYATYGKGSPILIIHGTPGGYDQIYELLQLTNPNPQAEFIIPSRPGYLRTPLSVGKTPQQQADALAALLDAIHVDRVIVTAVSGGGPIGLRFALQYPERCTSLVLKSAVTHRWETAPPQPGIAGWVQATFQTEFGRWLLRGVAQRAMLGSRASDPAMSAVMESLIRTTYPFDLRKAGFDNDIEQDRSITDWPIQDIRCPTLIIHGTADPAVPFEHAEFAHRIPGSRLLAIKGANHLAAITNQAEIATAESTFFAEHSGQ